MKLYEYYHKGGTIQKKVMSDNNFTYRNLIKILKKFTKKNYKILDIGCGVGTTDFYLARRGNKVTGIDISKTAINNAIRSSHFLKLNSNLQFFVDKFPNKKIKDSYDLVLLLEVLEHLKDDVKALNEVRKLLKPNGYLIISVPSVNAPLYRMGKLKQFDKRVGHLRRYSLESLVKLCKENGFKVAFKNKTEGILRNSLFTFPILGGLVKLLKWYLSDMVAFLDELTIPIFGESQIYLVLRKK